MSLGIYPEFETRLTQARFDVLGEYLASSFQTLDKIARAAKLPPFTSFADNREIPADFDGTPDELDEVMEEWNEWHDSAQGHSAIKALVDHIRSSPKAAKQLENCEFVIVELEELARILAVAKVAGIRFRLQMS